MIGKVRGRKKAIQTIIKDLMERIRDGEKTVFISHGDCLEEAEAIKQKLITDYGMENVQIEYVGPGYRCAYRCGGAGDICTGKFPLMIN